MNKRSFCVPAQPPGQRTVDSRRPGNRSTKSMPPTPSQQGGKRGYIPQPPFADAVSLSNRIADTGQATCFDDQRVIACPDAGQPFYGQDAHYRSHRPSYRAKGDGTVDDLITGLTWQKGHNAKRLGFYQAREACGNLVLGGYDDWRLPNIKELFTISDWRGVTGQRYFLDSSIFDLSPPDESILKGDPFSATHNVGMMGQTWSSTIYTGNHWDRPGVEAAFFFNFLDGRIKQAPTRGNNGLFYRCVRGPVWGINDFHDNGNGTVTDTATALMWQKADDGKARFWGDSLTHCEELTQAGRDDWRLPNVKELQSLVDYRHHNPAIDTRYFQQSDKDGWYWSSTTHGDEPSTATYVCFGKCVSVDGVDVHGAGAQRSDPKSGDPSQWGPMGGQRDKVRIFNYARCVRDANL
ncbi:MAG: DUF1566 domain-containing protein [Rhodospirillales bacterium]|nr:DUF1566 domain-containing protein [Rhodospirillales bacterium]